MGTGPKRTAQREPKFKFPADLPRGAFPDQRKSLNEQVGGFYFPMSKLTSADKIEIVRLAKAGLLQKEIAGMYRVTPSTINKVISANMANKREATMAARREA